MEGKSHMPSSVTSWQSHKRWDYFFMLPFHP